MKGKQNASRTARIRDAMMTFETSGWLDVVLGWIWSVFWFGIAALTCLGGYILAILADNAIVKGAYR